jgi:Zn-dependent protease with chaperone function
MDFFQHQEQARRNTGVLVLLFILAVVGTLVGVNLVVVPIVAGKTGMVVGPIVAVSVSVLAVVLVGMAIKFAQMSGGGRVVAEALGGKQISPDSRDPDERRALNVVEEMAIASGLPVPPVYLLQDTSINAFAAGNGPADSVVGLTAGCVHRLTRDELQGVVAHEFSHIFHQDTRLNMRLVGWLGGILALALVGQAVLRGMRHSSSRRKEGGAIVLIAVALLVMGYIGYFFGRLIQAAVSRQREFLADASAVQYTRNPDGLANALAKISAGAGSKLEAPRAGEFSHFFFASGISSVFSTHPPAEERIRRIRNLPLGELGASGAPSARVAHADRVPIAVPIAAPLAAPFTIIEPPIVPAVAIAASSVQEAVRDIGSLSPLQLDRAAGLISSAPRELVHATRDPFSARAVLVGLLLSGDARTRSAQLGLVARSDPRLSTEVARLTPVMESVTPIHRLPLLELCAASSALLSPHQYAQFSALLMQLADTDGQIDRFEWTVRIILRRAVERRGSDDGTAPRPGQRDMALVTSVLAYSGARDVTEATRAWVAARHANRALPANLLPAQECTLDAVDSSLRSLDRGTPREKRATIEGCVAAVNADGVTTDVEAELLRAFGAGMGVPMPPMQD